MRSAHPQPALFDLDPRTLTVKPAFKPAAPDFDLEGIALLYTATSKGNASGIRFALATEEAKTWCSHPSTKGQLHGTQWAFFWTTLQSFLDTYADRYEPVLDFSRCVDDGSRDAQTAEMGLTKIPLEELPALCEAAGIRVIPPRHKAAMRHYRAAAA